MGFMSITHHHSRVPHMALYTGTVLGFATMLAVWFIGGAENSTAFIGGTLLNMAVFGAMISYAMQGLSFILLREEHAQHRAAVPQSARDSGRGW